ncbi:hypothetical protein ABIE26_001613 [Pedobacter africanus]|uniref:Uncharacterized protein n=1 Tax=Pedobacter africanus TaxID=151894 RepID=A0ACC6KRX9_9SPHI|nr:hypothetical protein [Pedobacter africanus]MDR6781898.1 hypothetical protein [Pedobacter africanus]
MKTIKWIIAVSVLLINADAFSQTTVVQDTKGETALPVGAGGVVSINAKEESISASYGITLKNLKKLNEGSLKNPNYIGVNFKAKGKNGLASIAKNGEFQYDGSVGVFYFQDIDDKTVPYNSLFQYYVGMDMIFSQFKLYNPDLGFDKQVYDKNRMGYKATLGGSFNGKLTEKIPLVIGLAVNGGQKNNTGDLKAVDISNSSTVTDPVSGNIRTVQKDKTSAYQLSEYRNSVSYMNINADFGPRLFTQYQVLLHARWSMQEGRKPQWNPAAGLYFTKSGAPSEIVAGLQVQVIDWYNTAASTKSRGERTTFNVVAGFSF